ncbi:MAG: response regulator [Deltaproteobacteria bacterium]|nr:response regulator [Deltaproteobacteria bacterium]
MEPNKIPRPSHLTLAAPIHPLDLAVSQQLILIVDNELKSLIKIRTIMEREGYSTIASSSGYDALSKISQNDVGLVITAVDMDDMDGYELCMQVRASGRCLLAPFIFVAEGPPPSEKLMRLRLSLDTFLSKPVDSKSLLTRIQHITLRRQLLSQLALRLGELRGRLQQISLLELIYILEKGKGEGALEIRKEGGAHTADLFFAKGHLIDVSYKHLSGNEAFYAVLAWAKGDFDFRPLEIDCRRNINMSHADLIQEGAWYLERGNILLKMLPKLDVVLEVTGSQSALHDVVDGFQEVQELYQLIDGQNSVVHILSRSRLSLPRTMALLAEWMSLGDVVIKGLSLVKKPKTHLLIVDDSKLMCQAIVDIFKDDTEIEIIAVAHDGKDALEKIALHNPDVITLDVNMPVMDGLTTLKHIMVETPRPVVMLSSLTQEGSRTTFECLRYGAVDFISKPSQQDPAGVVAQRQDIIKKVRMAANTKVEAARFIRLSPNRARRSDSTEFTPAQYLIGLGADTGGYSALLKIVPHLSGGLPGAVFIMLNIKEVFLDAFIAYLNEVSPLEVKKAEEGDIPQDGFCYVTSIYRPVTLSASGNNIQINVSPPATGEKAGKSIDGLFSSIAQTGGDRAIGVILSGSGQDGIAGIKQIKASSGMVVIQKEESCLDPSLPAQAIEEAAVDYIVPDAKIPGMLLKITTKGTG